MSDLIPRLSGKRSPEIVPYEQRIAAFAEQMQAATVAELKEWSANYGDKAHAAKAELIRRGEEEGYDWVTGFTETR